MLSVTWRTITNIAGSQTSLEIVQQTIEAIDCTSSLIFSSFCYMFLVPSYCKAGSPTQRACTFYRSSFDLFWTIANFDPF
jgi:hypothetical protein